MQINKTGDGKRNNAILSDGWGRKQYAVARPGAEILGSQEIWLWLVAT